MTSALFVFVVLALLAAFVAMAGQAAGRRAAQTAASTMALWLGLTASLAALGLLEFGPVPPPVMMLVTVATGLTTWLGFSRFGTKLADRLPVAVLIGYQVFRVAVEIFLWLGERDGFVPVQMTWEGRNLDVLTGLTAPVVAWLAWRGHAGRRIILVWNCLGLALLVNIVGVAILSMPTPLRAFANEPANRFVATAPYVWLPVFLVQGAWLGHLLVFRWWARSEKLAG